MKKSTNDNNETRPKKRFSFWIWLLGLFLIFGLQVLLKDIKRSKQTSNLTENLEKVAEKMNKMAPIQIDEDARFDKAEVSGNTLSYHFTILSKFNDTEIATLKDAMQITACHEKRKEIDLFNKMNADLIYVYHDKQGEKLTEFEITNQNCS